MEKPEVFKRLDPYLRDLLENRDLSSAEVRISGGRP